MEPPPPVPTDPVARDILAIPADPNTRPSDIARLQWVDIGFWVRGDGSVDSAEVLRGTRADGWATPLLRMIEGRRYAPCETAADAGETGRYRMERYTWTADYAVPVGSLVRRRLRNPHYERIDLTEAEPTPAGS